MSFSCWNTFVCAVVIVFFDSVYAFRDGTPESPLNFTGGVSVPGKNESRYAAYSKWTKWSKCFVSDPSCEKKRFRVCLYQEAPDKCPHGPVLVQSKACKRKKCFGKSKYKSRFRLIDDLFERTTSLEEFFFTSWSQWTDCYLKECKQYRWKICSFELICKERLRVQQRHCNEDLQDMCLEFQKDFLPAETVREEEPQLEDHWTEATTKLPVMVTKHTKKPRVSFSKSDNMTCGVAPLSSTRISTKIFGGQPSTAGRWPWQVAILNNDLEQYCAGTLISNWIVTAAHCVRRRMYVLLGEHHISKQEETEQLYRPSKIIIHRHFNPSTIENDIALLKIDRISWNSYAHPICLPQNDDDSELFSENTHCTVVGWGKRRPFARYGADVLHEAEVEVIETERCRAAYYGDHPIYSNMICAGSGRTGNGDTCEGDSGGGLMCRTEQEGYEGPWRLFGITSFGDSCGKKYKYGVYTRTSSYLHWIRTVLHLVER